MNMIDLWVMRAMEWFPSRAILEVRYAEDASGRIQYVGVMPDGADTALTNAIIGKVEYSSNANPSRVRTYHSSNKPLAIWDDRSSLLP